FAGLGLGLEAAGGFLLGPLLGGLVGGLACFFLDLALFSGDVFGLELFFLARLALGFRFREPARRPWGHRPWRRPACRRASRQPWRQGRPAWAGQRSASSPPPRPWCGHG